MRPTYPAAVAALMLHTAPDPKAAEHLLTLGKAIGATCWLHRCASPVRSRGMCDRHYRAAVRDAKPCAHCSKPLIRRVGELPSEIASRAYCDRSCAGAHQATEKARRHREHIITEVEFLGFSDSPERIARRLGYQDATSIERSLARWGRHDLAARFRGSSVAA